MYIGVLLEYRSLYISNHFLVSLTATHSSIFRYFLSSAYSLPILNEAEKRKERQPSVSLVEKKLEKIANTY